MMSSKKQRDKNRATSLDLYYSLPPKHKCLNCGEMVHTGHFYPACFGGTSGYICEKKDAL